MYVAGIDGGQSSTTAVILDERGVVVGRGVAGAADLVDEPANSRRCADACEGALAQARAAAGLASDVRLAAVVVGLSGFEGVLEGVSPNLGAQRERFVHDAPIALAGAIARPPGVVVIAGTGSVAYGESAQGERVRVGGWGYFFGDEGSSFVLARTALAHAMSEVDRGVPSRLGDVACAYFNVPDLHSLVRAFSQREISRAELASFARLVVEAARLGDGDSAAMLDVAAGALSSLAAVAIERLELSEEAVPVALCGGLGAVPEVRARFAAHLAELAPHAQSVAPQQEPAVGAALLALADAVAALRSA
jgi:N-acetylglucosamine kinase-like BadF-type ATPase